MYQDLHSHTYYSFCGGDRPEEIVEAAINGGLDVFGITDHNYGVAFLRFDVFTLPEVYQKLPDNDGERAYRRYFDHINLIKEKYKDKIDVKRGIEICTLKSEQHPHYSLPPTSDISFFDYCLIENLDHPTSITGGDLFKYRERLGTPIVGIAHTDMFSFIKSKGFDPLDYFREMAKNDIFWEMNVSYDSIHNYREHSYMKAFFDDPEQ